MFTIDNKNFCLKTGNLLYILAQEGFFLFCFFFCFFDKSCLLLLSSNIINILKKLGSSALTENLYADIIIAPNNNLYFSSPKSKVTIDKHTQ